jgi:hypothetical protein
MGTTKKSAKKNHSGRRDLVESRAGAFYAYRTPTGQFQELTEREKSLAADRR